MKIQVRNHVFETNSSSMHSIAIVRPENLKGTMVDHYGWQLTADWLKPGKKIKINDPYVIDDESITFERWPFRILSTMYEKAQYAIASYGDKEHFDKISDICKELTGHELETPTEHKTVYYYTTGLAEDEEIPKDHILDYDEVDYDHDKEEYYRVDDDLKNVYDVESYVDEVPYYGYVDHQSSGILQSFLDKHDISLKDFLCDPKYIVIIDGDEYCAWAKMFEAGVCLRENFIDPGLPDH